MNCYDFDHTVYDGDVMIDFFLFSIKNRPSLLRYLPKQFFGFVLFKLGRISKTKFKECFFCFLQGMQYLNILEFWLTHKHKLCGWYLEKMQETDVIISASPEFLLEAAPIKTKNIIASVVDIKTGSFLSLNCYGEEKVKRYSELYQKGPSEFYSDSWSDLPMMRISEKSFLVDNRKDSIIETDANSTQSTRQSNC